jgi:hypothetical protein
MLMCYVWRCHNFGALRELTTLGKAFSAARSMLRDASTAKHTINIDFSSNTDNHF